MKRITKFNTDFSVPEGAEFLSSVVVGNQVCHYFLIEDEKVEVASEEVVEEVEIISQEDDIGDTGEEQ